MDNKKVKTCIGCSHYYVTWQPRTPRGCRFFGFKSLQMPCVVVKKTTGQDCPEYVDKHKEV